MHLALDERPFSCTRNVTVVGTANMPFSWPAGEAIISYYSNIYCLALNRRNRTPKGLQTHMFTLFNKLYHLTDM